LAHFVLYDLILNIKLEKEKNKKLTPNQALLKAANFCAYQERCHAEVYEKLNEWGIWDDDASAIVLQLIEQNYLNEERFAIAFAGGKFRVKKWGRIKIKNELKQRDISEYCIKKAMLEIDDWTYEQTIIALAQKKWEETKENNLFKKKAKVAAYLIGKGYESELIWQVLHQQWR
jgi:regulatory protein